jgi:hypothetical protein
MNQVTQTLLYINSILETLLPVATVATGMIGGSPVALGSLKAAQVLLPVIDEIIMKVGTREITLDTTGITTLDQVRAILKADDAAAFPKLAFKVPEGA